MLFGLKRIKASDFFSCFEPNAIVAHPHEGSAYCALRCFSAPHSCKECLFKLSQPCCQCKPVLPFSSSHTNNTFPPTEPLDSQISSNSFLNTQTIHSRTSNDIEITYFYILMWTWSEALDLYLLEVCALYCCHMIRWLQECVPNKMAPLVSPVYKYSQHCTKLMDCNRYYKYFLTAILLWG